MLRMFVAVQDGSLATDSGRKSTIGASRRRGETWAESYLAGLGSVILVATLLLVVGCSNFGKGLEPGIIQEEWSSNLHQLGLVPVFPPREDFFVGDVYSYDYDPESHETLELFRRPWSELSLDEHKKRLAIGMSPRLGRIDLSEHLVAEYKSTISAAPTAPAYNDLLRDPAVAAAAASVEEAQTSLDALEDQVKAVEQQLAEAEKRLRTAEHDKEDADADVKSAQDALSNQIEAAVAQAVNHLRGKEDALRKAEQRQKNAEVQAAKEAAEKTVRNARHERDDAKVALDRLREDQKAGVLSGSDSQRRLSDAESVQSRATEDLGLKTRRRDRQADRLERLRATLADDIDAARLGLEKAKALRDAIAAVGARHLYSQPQYEDVNVFTADEEKEKEGVGRLNRFRLVAFPEFSAASASKNDLSGLVPVDALGVGLNLAWEQVSQVVVKVPAAESYGLSIGRILPELVETDYICPRPAGEFLGLAGAAMRLGAPESDSVYLRVITEAFYARAMDISISSSKSFGAGGGVGLADSEPPSVDGDVERKPSTSQTATDLYSRVQAALDRTQTLPGASVEVIGYSDRSIGLRTVYDRPIAIGFRGLALKLDKKSGCFTDIGFAGSSVPTFSN